MSQLFLLVTGVPGTGKTLNVIKEVNESKQYKDRPIYYFNIKGLKLEWNELDIEGVKKWYDLPTGSVVIVDEAYKVFPTRKAGVNPPEYIQKLAEHRHLGIDFIFICQKSMGQIDAFVRGLVDCHWHLERRFGTKNIVKYVWQHAQDNVRDKGARNSCLKSVIRIDKKYFNLYKSAEVHTVKPSLPWARIALVVFLIGFLIYTVSSFVGRMIGGNEPVQSVEQNQEKTDFGFSNVVPDTREKIPMTKEEYLLRYVPRVPGIPSTAPIYDELTRPKDYPRLSCLRLETGARAGECTCYTQQATLVDVDIDTCNSIVDRGLYDPAKSASAVRRGQAAAPRFSAKR